MIRRDFFIFDGIESCQYGIYLAGPATADAAQRDVTSTTVPGRSGDLLVDNGRFLNQTLRYQCVITHGFEKQFAALKTALLKRQGYFRLEDTIHPEEYRAACFVGPVAPQTTPYNRAGQFELSFTCKPQRYLKRGELPVTLPTGGAARLMNPGLPALPLITVHGAGTGTLTVAGTTVTFLENFAGPLILDCDTQNAYWDGANKNLEIFAPEFPVLPAGECPISWTGGVERIEIVPRWWTL